MVRRIPVGNSEGKDRTMNDEFVQARMNKDKTYDGKFFFGVKTTGIFCRPSCPAPTAKEENVVYFPSVFSALENNFTPCYRCRPDIDLEYHNGNIEGSLTVSSAVQMIYEGYLNRHRVKDLARQHNVSERHLRKIFVDNIGVSPKKLAVFHRAIFAKKLIRHSKQRFTDIAYAAGFNSLRQFNDALKATFGKTPSEIRSSGGPETSDATLLLPYRQPFSFGAMLAYMRPRAIPGVERVTQGGYTRTFRTDHASGSFTVTDNPERSSLELTLNCTDVRCYMEIYSRVRKMFDIDTDMSPIAARLAGREHLFDPGAPSVIPRLPMAFCAFEFAVRAIIGQQISVKAATTLAGKIAAQSWLSSDPYSAEGLLSFFPGPEELLKIDLGKIGITKSRQHTLRMLAENVLTQRVRLARNQTFQAFYDSFTAIKGIGDWTANNVAMRALGMKDCFPVTDLGVIKALALECRKRSRKEMLAIAEAWRPYRSYATLCLWNRRT